MFTKENIFYKLTFPIVKRAASRKSKIPKKIKNVPNAVSPTPISEKSKYEATL